MDAVFVGKVRKVDEVGRTRIAEFEVERYWKGPGDKTVVVRSGMHIYGYRFDVGTKYLVYAGYVERETGEKALETSRCGRTTPFESAALDLKELGEGKIPE